MSNAPPVTVLLTVYNDLRYLPAAVESVLSQTFSDFEFIIINDGSTDGCSDYLGAVDDGRLRVLTNARNEGLTVSLNRGLEAARGRYVARMDADDLCRPDRLARQVEFLESHPQAGIVGSSRQLIDEQGHAVGIAHAAQSDLAIRWKCLLGNPFAHPAVMLRKSVVDRHGLRYESYRAEDYELWTRLLQHTLGENLVEPLLCYRLRKGYSVIHRAEQLANHDRIAHGACRRILPDFAVSVEQVRQLRGRYGGYSIREAGMDPSDPLWLECYRNMLTAFAGQYAERPGIEDLVERETARMDRITLID